MKRTERTERTKGTWRAAAVMVGLALGLTATTSSGQGLSAAADYRTTPVATNSWVPFPAGVAQSRIFAILAENSSGSDTWLHLFDTNGVPADGGVPSLAPVKITAGTTGWYDFGLYGLPFTNGLAVANSTTDRATTNGSASLVITVIYNRR